MQPQGNDDYDSPWKNIIDAYFPQFMTFFFPKAPDEIDWNKGYDFLDKEFHQVIREAELGRVYADKFGVGFIFGHLRI